VIKDAKPHDPHPQRKAAFKGRLRWFHGEEALTLAFLQALNGALEKGLKDKARELLPKIGKKLLQAGPVIGPAVNAATASVGGAVASGALDFAQKFFAAGDSIEKTFHQLSEALAKQKKRFLVIIDDIDRLTPDEALLVFRLVKSVGQLPNVMYLLVFDRQLAEKAAKDRYPSEGPHFLEKIIQASFELPLPARDDLNNAFLAEIEARCGLPKERDGILRFMNIFYDIVSPCLNSPRDLVRLANSISISWPPVASEVDVADFVALEVIRVFAPRLYNAIRASKERICGLAYRVNARDDRNREIASFLTTVAEDRHEWAKTALARLFPRLENIEYSEDFLDLWDAARLVCIAKHFDSYFRMTIGDDALPIASLNELIEQCADKSYVKATLLTAVGSIRKNGKSKVPLLLDELNVHANRIDKRKFGALISGLFEVADDIYRDEDDQREIMADTHMRIHWLIRKLTLERCTINERTSIFLAACRGAQLGWITEFTASAIRQYQAGPGKEPTPTEKCLVAETAIDELKKLALAAIKKAAADGTLLNHPQLASILFRWRGLTDDDGASAKNWTNKQLSDDIAVALLAKAFTSESWSQNIGMFGLGDRVAMRNIKVIEGLSSLVNPAAFRKRLEQIKAAATLAVPHFDYVVTLLDAWAAKEEDESSSPAIEADELREAS
jgi:predicted KAP-like P-loop ATPase